MQRVERVCIEIDRIPIDRFPLDLAEQIRLAAPDTISRLIDESRQRGETPTEEDIVGAMTLLAFAQIKGIPGIARAMVEKVNDRKVPGARRCAIASILVHLVEPQDFLPDTAPGHYGYFDDAILLGAGYVEYVDALRSDKDVNIHARLVDFLLSCAPPPVRAQLRTAIASLSSMIQIFGMMDETMAEATLAQLIEYPTRSHQPNSFAHPPIHAPRAYGEGRWWGKFYVEGNNVMMRGGPSLIDGQLFIPD